MNARVKTTWFGTAVVGILLFGLRQSIAQDALTLAVNRGTGDTQIKNDGSGPLDIDGYSISSASGLLAPPTWTSLASQNMDGWTEAVPRAQQISELNLISSSTVEVGGALGLGSAYNGLGILPDQEDVGFVYSTPAGDVLNGVVEFIGASRVPILMLDRVTGSAQIRNPSSGSLTIDGYSITSASGLLAPQSWTSLASQNVEGWTEANPREQLLSELNLVSSSTVEGGATLNLGNAYNAAAGAAPSGEDVALQYTTLDGQLFSGLVQYTSPPNDLVLNINPESGEAAIQNLSTVVDPFEITSYSILSASDALSVDGWNSLADQSLAGWVEANPRPGALAELNPTGSQLFDAGTVIPIGSIFTPGSSQDLEFQFLTLAGAVQLGTVQYATGGVPGDCNGDGVVDAGDLSCVSSIEERDIVLGALNTLPGDLDGNGDVAFPDFLTLSANFGQDLPSYTDGNIDLTGGVAFADFLTLSANFGQVPAGGATAAAVPEPSSGVLALCGCLAWVAGYRRRVG